MGNPTGTRNVKLSEGHGSTAANGEAPVEHYTLHYGAQARWRMKRRSQGGSDRRSELATKRASRAFENEQSNGSTSTTALTTLVMTSMSRASAGLAQDGGAD